jgi:hypothetical protein
MVFVLVMVVLVSGLSLAAALAVAAVVVDTTFSIDAHTEAITIVTGQAQHSRWRVRRVQMQLGPRQTPITFSGSLDVDSGVTVTFVRVADGPLSVSASAARSVGERIDEREDRVRLPEFVSIEVNDIPQRVAQGYTLLFPFRGSVSLGNETSFQTGLANPILRSGTVQMLATELIGRAVFAVGEVKLGVGDQFAVEDSRGPAQGILAINELPGMTAAFSIRGRTGRLTRPGMTKYAVRTDALARITKDSSFQLFWLLLAASLAGLLNFVWANLQQWWQALVTRYVKGEAGKD